jgi:hypothetical protein
LRTALRALLLQENGFTGPLPIGKTNRQLSVLRARLNDFSGTIPLEVWELPQLMTFDVTNNRWELETCNRTSSNCGSSQQQQNLLHGSVGAATADALRRHTQQVGVLNDTQQHEQQLRQQPAAVAAAVKGWQSSCAAVGVAAVLAEAELQLPGSYRCSSCTCLTQRCVRCLQHVGQT